MSRINVCAQEPAENSNTESSTAETFSVPRFFGPIARWLQDETVVEIMVNPGGSLFIERFGEAIVKEGSLRPAEVEAMVRAIATEQNIEAGPGSPVVSGEILATGHRFEGLMPPVVETASLSIRRHASVIFPLDSYRARGALTAEGQRHLREAIRTRQNILVAGGTSTGKTTFLNALFLEIAEQTPEARAVIIEDTREIQSKLENTVPLKASKDPKKGADARALLKSSLRQRPDRIIIGEVRDGVALDALKAWNTGHPGGLASVHANSASDAVRRMRQLIGEVSVQPQDEMIGSAIDLIVFLKRGPKGPVVEDMQRVGWSDGITLEKVHT